MFDYRAACLLALLTAGGCVHQEVITINATPALAAVADVSEDLLLDVGIKVFDPNVPEEIVEQNTQRLVAGVRNAEARYIPHVLRNTLQETGHWGAVRVLPRGSETVDVLVTGKILSSDGEMLTLNIRAVDASGQVWVDDDYSDLAGKLNYRDDVSTLGQDPFQDLYNQVANDLLAARQALTEKDIKRIRQVSEIKFAADIAPAVFGDYLDVDEDGTTTLKRLPAIDDPMLGRVQKIREREYLFIDTLDQHYGVFHDQIGRAYTDWRRFNYDEVVELRRLEREIRRRTIVGAAIIVGGLAVDAGTDNPYSSYAGRAGALVGLSSILSTLPMRPEVHIHAETMRELGDSFELEVRPAVLEVEGKTITLTGSADAQFEQWRKLLRDIYDTETGLPVVGNVAPQESPGS